MNETSIVTMSTGPGSCAGSMLARIRALDHDDAWIVSQTPVELAMTDVESDHAGRPALEEHIGKAAGRSADVERLATVDGDAEGIERMRQLDSAAPDIWVVRFLEGDFRILRDWRSGFLHGLAIDDDDAGQNQRRGTLARRGQAAIDKQNVQSNLQLFRVMTHSARSASRLCRSPAMASALNALS